MKVGSVIKSSETGHLAKIINFSDEAVLVEIMEQPTDRPTFRKVGEIVTIYRRNNDRWRKYWTEQAR